MIQPKIEISKWKYFEDKYPKAYEIFLKWIDKYKDTIFWDAYMRAGIKFHHLPYEMQQGIWMCFAQELLDEFFEQSEYLYHGDLEEDIEQVFKELEDALNYQDGNTNCNS